MTPISMRRGFAGNTGNTGSTALLALCCSVVLALSGLAARAADTAKVEGSLKDASGGVLSQAQVTLKPQTGAEKRTTTDAKGEFSFSGLPAGTYSVTIETSGYQTTRYTNVGLKEGQTRQFDFSLRAGAVSSPVEIDITRPLTQPDIDRLFVPAPGTPGASAAGTSGRGTIAGRILNGVGSPAQAIRVGVVAAETGIYGSPRVMNFDTRTDSMGFYRLEVPSGRYFVVAGDEVYSQSSSYFDRPVYFPGVPEASRALAIAVSPNSYDTADFRLDSPVPVVVLPVVPVPPPVFYYYGPYRVSGQVIFSPRILVPQPYPYDVYPQIYPYPYPYPYPYTYPDPLAGVQVILQSGGTAQRGCGPGRTAYSASVGRDGQFDFRSVSSGVYDVCVIQSGVVVYGRGGASSGAAPRSILYGPSTVVVDRDIVNLRLDIGVVAIYR